MAHKIHPSAANGNGALSSFKSDSELVENDRSYDSDSSSSSVHVNGGSNEVESTQVDIVSPPRTSLFRGCYEALFNISWLQRQTATNGNGNGNILEYLPIKKTSDTYKMDHQRIGKANKPTPIRRGSLPKHFFKKNHPNPRALDGPSKARMEDDEKTLSGALEEIGFIVERHHNLKSHTFHEKLNFLRNENHQDADCLLVIISTYGGDNTIFLSDTAQLPVHCLWTEYFEAHKCPSLAAKPKIFLVQAFSDAAEDNGDNVSRIEDFIDLSRRAETYEEIDSGSYSYSIPNSADIIVAFTYPKVSSVVNGSSLTLKFAQVFKRYAFEYDINKIFTFVSHLMKNNDAQHLVILSTLIREMKLKPKTQGLTAVSINQLDSGLPVIQEDVQYHLNTPRRGKAVVFNFDSYLKIPGTASHKKRDGSKKDLDDLRKLFEDMSFDFVPHSDLTHDRFTAELKKIQEEDHSQAECLVVVVMTHGEQNRLIMADHTQFPVNFVWKYFEDHTCPSLRGKPKIFIIQACRGSEYDDGTCVSYVEDVLSASARSFIDSPSLSCIKPMSSDMVVAYSTPFGKYSWRDEKAGSWFIQEVVKVFSKHHKNMDIHELFTTVARNVAINYTTLSKKSPSKKQVPCITSTLTKTYRFSDRPITDANVE